MKSRKIVFQLIFLSSLAASSAVASVDTVTVCKRGFSDKNVLQPSLSLELACANSLGKSGVEFSTRPHLSKYLQQHHADRERLEINTRSLCGKKTNVGCTGPNISVRRKNGDFLRVDNAEIFSSYAREFNIDPLLLVAISVVESGGNNNAISPKGALGLMQIMPATAKSLGHHGAVKELYDPIVSVRLACVYLRSLYRRFGNDIPLILAAYNAGEGAVIRYGMNIPPYPETQDYVKRVLNKYVEMRSL